MSESDVYCNVVMNLDEFNKGKVKIKALPNPTKRKTEIDMPKVLLNFGKPNLTRTFRYINDSKSIFANFF